MSENIYGKYNEKYRDKINSLFIEREPPSQESFQPFSDKGMFGIKSHFYFIKFFHYTNGYVGFDLSVIRYNSYHLIFWLYILQSNDTSQKEKDTATAEIRIFFYQWIGAIYSFKSKLLEFVGAKVENQKIIFTESCLSIAGQNEVKTLFNSYKHLLDLFNVRNRIIHNTNEIEFMSETCEIIVRYFGFTMKSCKDNHKKDIVIFLNDKFISECQNAITGLLEKYISIVKNLNNIDYDKFKGKYTDSKGNFRMSI